MKSFILTLLLISGFFGYRIEATSIYYAKQAKTENCLTPTDEDDIREAVFRYQFEHNASGQQQNAKVYFLSLGEDKEEFFLSSSKDKEPSDVFMLRFIDHKPPVKKLSQARGKFEAIDRETGEQGLIFNTTTIRQINENKVEVDGGYYEGALSASGNTYTVEHKDNKWVVTKDFMHWIS